MRLCAIEDCRKVVLSVGYCAAHYAKLRRYGNPTGGRPSPEELFWAKVNKTDTCWLWTGVKGGLGYGHFKSRGKNQVAHRYAYELLVGPIGSGLVLDHYICFDRSCVNPDHLRQVTQAQNSQNRAGLPSNNTSGYRGVYYVKNSGKYQAKFRLGGTDHHVGLFSTALAAHEAVSEARRKHMPYSEMDKV